MRVWLFVLLGLTAAHNWVASPSRVPFAATVFPCLPPRNEFPHVQVGQGQRFQIEWSTGHDRDVFFVLFHKNDTDHLGDVDEQELDDYITRAPAGAHLESPTYHKYHRTWKAPTDTHYLGGTLATQYKRLVPTNDPLYIPRPADFGDTTLNLYEYKDTDTARDVYISYSSSIYPYVKAVWRFAISAGDPGEVDTAYFNIPTQFTTNGGDFIVHYIWSGYYDCIDVNVLPRAQATTYPYGQKINGSDAIAVNRVDHCIFDQPYQYMSFPRLVFGPAKNAGDVCTEACRDNYENGCGGVVVLPLNIWNQNYGPHWNTANNIIKDFYVKAWNTTFDSNPPFSMDVGIPYESGPDNGGQGVWRVYVFYDNGFSTGYSYEAVNQTTISTIRTYTESFTDAWVCIPVQPRYATTTKDKYTLTDDPLDPVWFSTCYEVTEQLQFIGFNLSAHSFQGKIPYRQLQGKCISCADSLAWKDPAYAPTWKLATCRNCERDDPTPTVIRPAYMNKIYTSGSEDGSAWESNCVAEANSHGFTGQYAGSDYCVIRHWAYHPLVENNGDLQIYWQMNNEFRSPEQCVAFMTAQTECSQYVFHGFTWDACRCVRNTPCCLQNMQVATWATDNYLYESRQSTPDPRCATGLKNSAGTICCKNSTVGGCLSNGCSSSGWPPTPGSLCRTDMISPTRSCSQYGPPCYL